MSPVVPTAPFEVELARLLGRLRGRSPSWFGAVGREPALRRLTSELAELAVRAGGGAPDGRRPPALGVHALADQIAVLAHELLAAPQAADLMSEGVVALRKAGRELDR